ncbi:MAG: VWA domain-containing protein [Candidatus Omnitrophota bacterium]
MIRLQDPVMLFLCLLLPLFIFLGNRFSSKTRGSLRFSNSELLKPLKPPLRLSLRGGMVYLRAAGLLMIIFALARPQSVFEQRKIYVEGIDIVLAIDVSSSMRAMDFQMEGRRVDRLEVVMKAVSDFIAKRPDDRIGVVAFASYAYTVCPLTLDHEWAEKNLDRVQIGMVEDGTAIGAAISAALNRLKDTGTKEKIIILLTDGRNNAGRISPMMAAEAAKALGVRIYTIGAGTKGLAPYPVKDMLGNVVLKPVPIEIDEDLLKKIANETGGIFFRATDTESLERIYEKIDEMEKTPMEETGYNFYEEMFGFLLIPAIGLLLLEIFLSNTLLRSIP